MADDVRRKASSAGSLPQFKWVFTEVDQLSNSILTLIGNGDLDAAESACRRLLIEYPEQVDGLMRLATVHEARGSHSAAALYYRKAAQFMRSHDDFDEESIANMLAHAERMDGEQRGRA